MAMTLKIVAFLSFVFAAMVAFGALAEGGFALKAILVGIFGLVGVVALIGAGMIEAARSRK